MAALPSPLPSSTTATPNRHNSVGTASQAGVTGNYLAHKVIEHNNNRPRIIRATVGCRLPLVSTRRSYTGDS